MSRVILITVYNHLLMCGNPVAVCPDTETADREMDRLFAAVVADEASEREVHVSELSAETLDYLEETHDFAAAPWGLPFVGA